MSEEIRFSKYYGSIKPSVNYPVVDYGYDYVTVRAQGKIVHVPKILIDRRRHIEELEEYQDAIS